MGKSSSRSTVNLENPLVNIHLSPSDINFTPSPEEMKGIKGLDVKYAPVE
jgi:hypothetical protein